MAAPTGGDVALMVGVEMLGVGVFTLIAGASDDAGKIVVLFMVGLWVIFLVTNSKVIASIDNGLANVVSQGS
jgi:hypothetical protein